MSQVRMSECSNSEPESSREGPGANIQAFMNNWVFWGRQGMYEEKLYMLQLCTNPYFVGIKAWLAERSLWLPVEFPDVFVYLIKSPNSYTKGVLKAYSSTYAKLIHKRNSQGLQKHLCLVIFCCSVCIIK